MEEATKSQEDCILDKQLLELRLLRLTVARADGCTARVSKGEVRLLSDRERGRPALGSPDRDRAGKGKTGLRRAHVGRAGMRHSGLVGKMRDLRNLNVRITGEMITLSLMSAAR